MPKPWLKSWSSSLDNPKIQLLTGDQFKAWHNLLWIALRHDRGGELPSMQLIAFQLRLTIPDAEILVKEQMSLGLVENGGSAYVIHDWNHWQGEAKSDAERQAEKRSRDKGRNSHVTPTVTNRDMSRDLAPSRGGVSEETRQEETRGEGEESVAALPPVSLGPEYRRVGELAMQLAGDVSWGPFVHNQGLIGHPADWIEQAIKRCPQDKFGQDYIAGTLRGYQRAGGPPKDKVNGKPVSPTKAPIVDTRTKEQLAAEEKNYQELVAKEKAKQLAKIEEMKRRDAKP